MSIFFLPQAAILILDTKKLETHAMRLYKSNLSDVVRGFKSACTRRINEMGLTLFWQPRFYDRVLRNNKELHFIRKYIRNNPSNWELDEENPWRIK